MFNVGNVSQAPNAVSYIRTTAPQCPLQNSSKERPLRRSRIESSNFISVKIRDRQP